MNDKLTGSYFLRTNLVSLGARELWQLYNTLRGIEDDKTLYHRSSTKAEHEQKEIYKALGISSQILKAHKTIL